MASTASCYAKWLLLYVITLIVGIALLFCGIDLLISSLLIVLSLLFDVYYAVRLIGVKNYQKKAKVYDGKYVGLSETNIDRRYPKFSVKFEIEVDGKQIVVETPGVYTSGQITELKAGDIVKIGYIEGESYAIIP